MIQKRYHRHIGCLLFFLLLMPARNILAQTVEPPKNPNSAKGCAICHYRWIDTFFIDGKGTDLVPYQSEKVAADEEMCISCHDGSVADSRARILHGKEHKTDVAPPADMTIPEIFPLDEDGKVQCATCHTAHGVASGPGVQETIFLRVSNIDSAMCQACHADKAGGPEAGNHSLAAGKKKIPDALKVAGAHEGSEKNQMICETCHTAHGSASEGYLVRGAGDSGLCLTCHTDQNMFDASGQRNSNHAVNMKPRTAVITRQLQEDGAKLGYDGIFTCQTCHKIHNNKPGQPKLLFINNRKSDLCMECHPDMRRLGKTKHNLAISAKEEKNLEGETAGEAGMCSACHLPHKAARKPYMKDENTDRTTAMCLSCHAMGMVAQNEKLTGYSHPTGVTLSERATAADASEYRKIVLAGEVLDLPLYTASGDKSTEGIITCATCHDTHGGAPADEADTDPSGMKGVSYSILRESSPVLCRTCHADKFDIETSRHDFSVVFPQGSKILEEKAPEGDLCRNCHQIHSVETEGFVIWSRKVVTDTGIPVVDMCIACHEEGGLASDIVVPENSHPVNTSLTEGIRTSMLPLFDGSGKLKKDGIMTCHTCHDPHHRSPVTTVGGETVSGEKGPIARFLRIDVAPASDLCISCHRDKAGVRRTSHNLAVIAPDAKNTADRTAYESGVCSACHLAHNSRETEGLWAQEPADDTDDNQAMNRVCRSCHSEKGAAADKVPGIATHPDILFVNQQTGEAGTAPAFPVFDKTTADPATVGGISCPVCHNAHQWRPDASDMDSYIGAQGDAGTSFLRAKVPQSVCRQCHGVDGLFLYTYFHKDDIRTEKEEE